MKASKTAMGVFAALMVVGATGCKNPEIKQTRGRTVKANIAEFDPNADYVLDLDKYGSERPDDYAVQMAFNQAFEPMDQCVLQAKKDMGLKDSAILKGDIEVAVQLDPHKGKAAAVNATLPKKYAKNESLKDCLRNAVGEVQFPKYDGPPTVAEFSCELDAGFDVEEDW